PPLINCPADIITTNDPGRCSAPVSFEVSAIDDCGSAYVVCDNPNGSIFRVGTTTVTCTAMDTSSNIATCTFTVTVRDTEGPLVACRPVANPLNKTVPIPEKNPAGIENPNGYYQ